MLMDRAEADRLRCDHAWRRLRFILTGLVLCRGMVLLCVIPPFEGWDEYNHVAYIVHLNETGSRPWFGHADVPFSLQTRLPAFPHCQWALEQIGSLGAVDYRTFWGLASQGTAPVPNAPTPGSIGLYQAQHGPLYYALVSPLFASLGGVGNLKRAIGGLRTVNLFLTAGSVWVALGIIARLVRDRRLAAFSGLLIAIQPLFLINGVRVANDALGVFLATVSIGSALHTPRRYRLVSSLGIGMMVGLAVLAKSVHFGIIPFIAACWLWESLSQRDDGQPARIVAGRALLGALALTCGFLVMTQSEFRANWTRYGSFTLMQEAVANRRAGHGPADLLRTARSISWPEFARIIWLRKNLMTGGWSWAGEDRLMYCRYKHLLIASLFGWAWSVIPARRRRIGKQFQNPAVPWLWLAVCIGYTASLSYHAVQSTLCWGTSSTMPWYAAAAYPWFLALVTAGALAWPVGRLRFALPLLLFAFYLQTEATIVLGSMISTYTAGASWSNALQRLAFLQPSFLGTKTLYAAIGGVPILASVAVTEALSLARDNLPTHQMPPAPHFSIPTVANRTMDTVSSARASSN